MAFKILLNIPTSVTNMKRRSIYQSVLTFHIICLYILAKFAEAGNSNKISHFMITEEVQV